MSVGWRRACVRDIHISTSAALRRISWDRLQVGFVRTPLWVMPDPEKPGQNMGWFDDRVQYPLADVDGRLIGLPAGGSTGIKYQKYQNYPYTKKAYSLTAFGSPRYRKRFAVSAM